MKLIANIARHHGYAEELCSLYYNDSESTIAIGFPTW